VTNATMAGGKANAYATQNIKMASENILNKTMDNYTSGTVLTFNMDINTNGEDLIYKTDENDGTKLEIMDVMSSKMSLATYRDNYFVVTDGNGNELTEAASDAISSNEYYVTQVESTEGTAYKIIVPDGKKLHIKYLVSVDAAVKEWVDISNKAYFVYEGLQAGDTGNKVEQNVQISSARGSSGTSADNPSFKIYKKDQWGNPVAGVTFTLYKVTLNSEGKEASKSVITSLTTDATGYVEFKGLEDLVEDGVYCFKETAVPTGYVKSEEGTYFYFTAQSNLNIDGAIGIDYNEKVFKVTNQFSPASLTVPLTKTINGKDQESKDVFGFTLTKTNGDTVYSDEKCTSPVTSTVVSIEGSGTVNFDTLYFKEPGQYTFTLSENDLTEAEISEGFTKSDVVYTITANVDNGDNGLYMDSVNYTWTDTEGTHTRVLSNDNIPVFNNTLTQKPVTIKLEAVKQLTGDTRSYGIQDGEFTFAVVENGEIVAHGRTTGTTTNKVTGVTSTIDFDEITYTQDQLGTHVLTIYEESGSSIAISYSQTKFFATVVVEPVDGKAELQATVTYSTQNKNLLTADGLPIFINKYTDIPITGIRVDTLPYIVGIAIVACGGTLMFVRRRKKQ
jgi:pilin isopeptide linkage protein